MQPAVTDELLNPTDENPAGSAEESPPQGEREGPLRPNRVAADVLGHTPRGPWSDVPDALWNDWRWQQRNRLRTADDLARVVHLTDGERRAIDATAGAFRMALTPYYATLMDPDDPACPVRAQAIPRDDELRSHPADLADPLGEERYMPVPGITHRYPDRVLFYVTHNCPVYCRHCTRKRKVSDPTSAAAHDQLALGLDYIRRHEEVRDVLVSGGDPLTLSDDRLDELLGALRDIPHVEVIRLCTRNPVTLPQRFTRELIDRLAQHHPIFVHTHFNTPRECTPEAARCLRALADRGLNVANQMVLLRGVNDDARLIRETNVWLLRQRCRPYYLFQADLAEGISHFRVPVAEGLEILRALRGPVSGMAVPTYVIDAPGGGGKIPLVPDYIESRDEEQVIFRNWKGDRYAYPSR
jgi:lysine 2,3-aminomutase